MNGVSEMPFDRLRANGYGGFWASGYGGLRANGVSEMPFDRLRANGYGGLRANGYFRSS